MKKSILVITLLLTVCMLFAACGEPAAPTATPPAVSPTLGDDADPTSPADDDPTDAPQNMADPLNAQDMLLSQASIDDIVSQYGEYSSFDAAYYTGTGYGYVRLNYSDMVIELCNEAEENFSFADESGFGYGDSAVTLSDADKAAKCRVTTQLWTKSSVNGPRGAKIGDAMADVRALFMDLSDGTSEGALYAVTDVYPDFPVANMALGGASYRAYSSDNDAVLPGDITADYVLEYIANDDPSGADFNARAYQYTKFYFSDGVVVAIEQGYSPEEV